MVPIAIDPDNFLGSGLNCSLINDWLVLDLFLKAGLRYSCEVGVELIG